MRSRIFFACRCFLWIFCLSASCTSGYCLSDHSSSEIRSPEHPAKHIKVRLTTHILSGVRQFPYNKIIVLDNRLNRGRVGVTNQGHVLEFDQPADAAVAAYIGAATKDYPKNKITLLLNIKRLDCSRQVFMTGIQPGITLSADAYYSIDGLSFILLRRMSFQRPYNDYSIGTCISREIDNAIASISFAVMHGGDTLSQEQINQRSAAAWADYPINHSMDISPAGYYANFSGFKNDSLIHRSFRMKMQTDSTYRLILPPDAWYSYLPESDVWALKDSAGRLYIHLGYHIFLPMERWNNSFRFQIPAGLAPDSYVIPAAFSLQVISEWAEYCSLPEKTYGWSGTGGGSGFTPDFTGATWGGLLIGFGVIIAVAGTVYIVKAIVKQQKAKKEKNKMNKAPVRAHTHSRELFLAMDTGDFINV